MKTWTHPGAAATGCHLVRRHFADDVTVQEGTGVFRMMSQYRLVQVNSVMRGSDWSTVMRGSDWSVFFYVRSP